MAQQNINLGTPNGEDGDFVRVAFSKTEDNFTELYNLQNNIVIGNYYGNINNDYSNTLIDRINDRGLTVEQDEIYLISAIIRRRGVPVQRVYAFRPGKGTYNNGNPLGYSTSLQYVSELTVNTNFQEAEGETIDLGDIGASTIEDYINALSGTDYDLLDNIIYFFTTVESTVPKTYLWAGTTPINIGDGGTVVTSADFDLIAINGVDVYNDIITSTQQILNEGADGTSTYVETNELGNTAFSNDYNDLDNLPTLPDAPTGFEALDEGNGIGWRLIGRNPSNHGNIGLNAIDGSYQSSSGINGATGDYSVALGDGSKAPSFGEFAFGSVTSYTPNSTTAYNSSDRLFTIGVGADGSSDQFTILKGGKVGINIDNFESFSTTALFNINGTVRFSNNYGAGSTTGTATYSLAVDSNGYVIETGLGGYLEKIANPLDSYFGNRLTPVSDDEGFYVNSANNKAAGYLVNNTSTGNVALSGFRATIGSDPFDNGIYLGIQGANYYAPWLREHGLIMSKNLNIATNDNTGSIIFSLGNTGTTQLTETEQDKVFLLNSDRTIVFPSLTEALIDSEATGRTPVTREWIEAQSFGTGSGDNIYTADGSITAATERVVTIPSGSRLTFEMSDNASLDFLDGNTIELKAEEASLVNNDGDGIYAIEGNPLLIDGGVGGVRFNLPIAPTIGQILKATSIDGDVEWADNISLTDVAFLTGSQTFTGSKTFNTGTTTSNIISNNTSNPTGAGILATNTASGGFAIRATNNQSNGFGIYVTGVSGTGVRADSSTGTAFYGLGSSSGINIHSEHSGSGNGIYSTHSGSGNGITSNISTAGSGLAYVGQNNGTNTFTVTKAGVITGSSVVVTGKTSDDILLGDGTTTSLSGIGGGSGDALTTNPLSQFASTTSSQLAGVISDETGSGALVFATSPTLVTPNLGVPTSITLTNATGLPISGLTSSTITALGVGSIELGHASDTTISRSSAGNISVEGNLLYRAGGTDVPVTDGGTGRSTGTTAYCLIATGTTATGAQQTLGSGATTQILVGGGASSLPVWTTATGTGAPVRATSPTFVTPILGTPTSGDLSNCTFPTLNQNTTGSAATLTTTRTIWGQNFNGSANVTGALTGVTDITLSGLVDGRDIAADGALLDSLAEGLLTDSSTITTSRNHVATDADGMNNSTSATDVTITIQDNTTVPQTVGTLLQYKRSGAGNVLIAYAGGVTGTAVQTYSLDDVITLRKTATNTWEALNPPKFNGFLIKGQTVGGSNGNAVYLSGSNTWSQTDASAEATSKSAIGIRISATEVLTHGVYTTSGLTAGATYFLSETAGAITTTAPTTAASIVRIIGYALTTTELFVNTDNSYFANE